MTTDAEREEVHLVPLDRIIVVNPRVRNRKAFKEIVENIAQVGLKKPITVTRRDGADGIHYDLVCGQGRVEAYRALGQTEIPAFVIEADPESGLVMSLVENLARRQHRAIDLLHDIQGLKQRGYEPGQIAAKTGLTQEYVRAVIGLLEAGEHRLLRAVESGQMPVSVAVEIAEASDADVQRVLQQAYESKLLRGRKLLAAKRLLEQRRRRGKEMSFRERKRPLSVQSLLRTYRESTDRKRLLVRKAEATRADLLKDKHLSINTFWVLKRMAPLRQIEAAELMNAMNKYTCSYARSLLAATAPDQLVEGRKPKANLGLSIDQMALMERESASLEREFKMVEQSYGTDHLDLVLAKGFLAKLLRNARAVRYLAQHHGGILAEFQKLAEMESVAA